MDQRGAVSPARPHSSSSSIRTAPQPTIMAIQDYTACDPYEVSLTTGEIVSVIFEPDNINDGREWVLCKAGGEEGFVPRQCLNARFEV